jgi:hypothetical protein
VYLQCLYLGNIANLLKKIALKEDQAPATGGLFSTFLHPPQHHIRYPATLFRQRMVLNQQLF